jgi:hypothetical protein
MTSKVAGVLIFRFLSFDEAMTMRPERQAE